MNRIIIAEDHEPTRKCIAYSLKSALKDEGIFVEIDEVSNRGDLVERVLKENFAVALIDNNMPNNNEGLGAIKDIKEFKIPTALIMISSPEYKEQALAYGADEYVIKPHTNLISNIVKVIKPYLSA